MIAAELIEGPQTRMAYDALRMRVKGMYPGVPLPPVPELMEELSVGRATLDKVYAQLDREGLIERKRRKGVFVADRLATGEIAIVLSQIYLSENASPSYARICARLRQELHEFNPKWAVKLHLGVSSVPGPDMPATLDLLEPTVLPRLRGVLRFGFLYEMETELAAAGVPVVHLDVELTSRCVGVFGDHERMLRDGIRHLAESGCRSICLLHTRYVGKKPMGPDRTAAAAAAAADCGLKFRDEWIGYEEGGWHERHGYELFMRLWRNAARPDGIMVDDDILCHGVLRAILELRVDLPRDLRLVTQASRGGDFPYPRPVTRVEYNLEEFSNKAMCMLATLATGQPLKNTIERVQATLVKGETT